MRKTILAMSMMLALVALPLQAQVPPAQAVTPTLQQATVGVDGIRTEATVIVEAGETSGSLTQARAALHQGRKLFILDSCFQKGLTWPARFEAEGAIRVRTAEDIWAALG